MWGESKSLTQKIETFNETTDYRYRKHVLQ